MEDSNILLSFRINGHECGEVGVTATRRPCRVLLINPNSAVATTTMMVAIARGAAGSGYEVTGATATKAPPMIIEPEALKASAAEVVEIAVANQDRYEGIIVAAFGDPGLTELRSRVRVPAVGIAEAAMLHACAGGRRFGVATTTPRLAAGIDDYASNLGLARQYTGVRITDGDPTELIGDPERLCAALADTVERCIAFDGAEAVIIGGGPLGQAALQLQSMFSLPIVAPIEAAARRLIDMLRLRCE